MPPWAASPGPPGLRRNPSAKAAHRSQGSPRNHRRGPNPFPVSLRRAAPPHTGRADPGAVRAGGGRQVSVGAGRCRLPVAAAPRRSVSVRAASRCPLPACLPAYGVGPPAAVSAGPWRCRTPTCGRCSPTSPCRTCGAAPACAARRGKAAGCPSAARPGLLLSLSVLRPAHPPPLLLLPFYFFLQTFRSLSIV